MSIFRKDRDKPEKAEKTGEFRAVKAEEPDDSYTDISEAAYDSSPKNDSKMEEIYSTKDKHVKFRRETPLETEAANKRMEAAKDELKKGKLEFVSTEDDETPEVKLEAELDPNAVVSEEIIEDVVDVKKLRNIYVQDIDDIDVSLDPMENLLEYQRKVNNIEAPPEPKPIPKPAPEPEYTPSGDTIVARVPVYRHESSLDNIYLKAGRFTSVVESEYNEYLKSTDPTISKNYHSMQPDIKPHQSLLYTISQAVIKHRNNTEEKKKNQEILRSNFDEDPIKPVKPAKEQNPEKQEKKEKEEKPPKPVKSKKRSVVGKFLHVLKAAVYASFSAPSQDEQERAMDYSSREDEKYISDRIRKNLRRQIVSLLLYLVIGVVMSAMVIWERTNGAGVMASGSDPSLLYCGIMLILSLVLGLIARHTLIDGLKPLRRFKANADTVLTLAYIACVIQGFIALFTPASFVGGDHHLYSFIIALALILNTTGRLLMVLRVKSNFEFICSRSPAYAAKIYNDEETARRMVSGTTASKGVVAYQHVTSFLSDFLKISYAPDPSEELPAKLSPAAIVVALFVTVLYAILFKSIPGAISALSVMLCISIPFTAMLAGNLPMLLFSRRMLDEDAMIAGYPSVRQFCDTSALIMSAGDLFPDGCVSLEELIPLQQYRVNESLLMAAAVLREGASPIAQVFDGLVIENNNILPSVESVMYEDKSGLVGWINGERILIGNMTLMNRYHITVPDESAIRRQKNLGREITYVAVSGQAVAVLALAYSASPVIKSQIEHAEHSGLAIVVGTTDANVTAELIADRYELFFRSVKVTVPGYTNVIDEVTTKVEETSRSYVATRGKIGSLARAVSGCIRIKSNIRLGILIEVFGTILGILLCATLALYASVARLSMVELLIYIAFWTGATLIAELIKKP